MRTSLGTFTVGLVAAALNASFAISADRVQWREQVLEVLERRADAGRRRDVTAFDRIYSDDYFHTNADGSVMNKAAVLASYRAPAVLEHPSSTTSTDRVFGYGDCAIVSELTTVSGVRGGEPVVTRFRVTSVLVRAKGQWRIAASHASVVPGSAAAGAPARSEPSPIHEFDFRFETQQPIVLARVNGGRAVPFLVDTAASINIVDESIAREAHVSTSGARELSGGGEGRVTATLAGSLRIDVNGAAWPGQRASVVNLGYPTRKHFAGILGAPVLTRYTVQFDFGERRLRLFNPTDYSAPQNATIVPFELQDNLPIVQVSVDAGVGPLDARLMVDTGASQFVDLNRPFVDAHGLLQVVSGSALIQRPAGIGGTAPVAYATGRRVTLAGLSFDAPRLGLSRATAGSSAATDRDGILGNDLLRHFRATMDYSRRVLVLERNN